MVANTIYTFAPNRFHLKGVTIKEQCECHKFDCNKKSALKMTVCGFETKLNFLHCIAKYTKLVH